MPERFVEFPSRGLALRGVIHEPASGRAPGVLFLHGLAGDHVGADYLHVRTARALASRGIASLRFDFAGAGDSDGEFEDMTFSSALADARGALEFLARRATVDRASLGVVGHSMGGCVAAMLLDDERVAVAALLAAVASTRRLLDDHDREAIAASLGEFGHVPYGALRIGRGMIDEADTIDPLEAVRRSAAAVLVMHGTADETVLPAHAELLREALTTRPRGDFDVVMLPEMAHRPDTPARQDEVIRRTVDWLVKALDPRAARPSPP